MKRLKAYALRLVAVASLALMIACSSCAPSLPQPVAPDVRSFTERAVLLETECQSPTTGEWELKSWGSGVQTRDNTVLTAFHVVEETKPGCRVIASRGGKKSLIHIVHKDKEMDLAWLYTPGLHPVNLPVEIRRPLLGERIACVGYPFLLVQPDRIISVTRGEVATLGMKGGRIRFTAPIYPGNSGGGCFAESDGALVLIVNSYIPGREGYFFGRSP